jgi:hypothetical protein
MDAAGKGTAKGDGEDALHFQVLPGMRLQFWQVNRFREPPDLELPSLSRSEDGLPFACLRFVPVGWPDLDLSMNPNAEDAASSPKPPQTSSLPPTEYGHKNDQENAEKSAKLHAFRMIFNVFVRLYTDVSAQNLHLRGYSFGPPT